MQVKIGDFGLACMDQMRYENAGASNSNGPLLAPSSPHFDLLSTTSHTHSNSSNHHQHHHGRVCASSDNIEHTMGVGTSLYASPEQLSGKHYDTKVQHTYVSKLICQTFCSCNARIIR